MLTRLEKSYIRDLLGVPMGNTDSPNAGYRFLGKAGQLELYLNNLYLEDECIITGRPVALVNVMTGAQLVSGQTLTLFINGQPVSYTTTDIDLADPFPRKAVVTKLVNALQASGLLFQAYSSEVVQGAPTYPNSVPTSAEVYLSCRTAFTLSYESSGTGSGFYAQVLQDGDYQPEPSLDVKLPDGTMQTVYGYLPICLQLRKDIGNSRLNLALTQAGSESGKGGVKFRQDELQVRIGLFRYYTEQMGNALYAGPDPTGRLGVAGSTRVII